MRAQLKAAGLDYYNHNLDTAPEYYADIVQTRAPTRTGSTRWAHVRERRHADACCGGIVGMGESARRSAPACSQAAGQPAVRIRTRCPSTGLVQRAGHAAGTALAQPVDPFDFVRTIAVARIAMPTRDACGLSAGSPAGMGDADCRRLCFLAGANSIFYGDKLLVTGNPDVEADVQLLRKLGLQSRRTTTEQA